MTNAKGEATTHVTGGFTCVTPQDGSSARHRPTPIAVALGGKVIRMLALPLAGLQPGQYDLVLDISGRRHGPYASVARALHGPGLPRRPTDDERLRRGRGHRAMRTTRR